MKLYENKEIEKINYVRNKLQLRSIGILQYSRCSNFSDIQTRITSKAERF